YNFVGFYSADFDEELVAGVGINIITDSFTQVDTVLLEVYEQNTITRITYPFNNRKIDYNVVEVFPHPFGEVPCIEFLANDERQVDFEGIIPLIDAYDTVVSDAINEIESWGNSYLLIKNLQSTEYEDVQRLKESRVMLVDGDGDANFLERKVNDNHVQNMINIITTDIHKFSQSPNLSDEQFATNLSGTAIRYKMLTLENRTSMKERKFTTAIMKRLSLIAKSLNIKGEVLV